MNARSQRLVASADVDCVSSEGHGHAEAFLGLTSGTDRAQTLLVGEQWLCLGVFGSDLSWQIFCLDHDVADICCAKPAPSIMGILRKVVDENKGNSVIYDAYISYMSYDSPHPPMVRRRHARLGDCCAGVGRRNVVGQVYTSCIHPGLISGKLNSHIVIDGIGDDDETLEVTHPFR